MNRDAERHLDKAAGYLERGEGYYRKAAEEIIAAQTADPTLSNQEVGQRFGRSKDWVRKLVQWRTTGAVPISPFAEPNRESTDVRGTRRVLREAPLEQVEEIVGSLSRERRQAIAAAAGSGYAQARQEQEEQDRQLTDAQRRERDREHERQTRTTRQAVGHFASLGIVGHLEQATEELRELNADASLTEQAAHKIEEALDAFATEFKFARAMLGEEATG